MSLPSAPAITIGRVDLAGLAASSLGRFLAVGLVGLGSDAAVFALLHGAGESRAAARAVSLIIATAVTWRLNRAFTFAATRRRQHDELVRYVAVALVAQGINYSAFLLMSALLPRWPALVLLVAGAVFATGFSYLGQRLFTFAPAPRVLSPASKAKP
jgi:putative flippase GtrA